MPKLSQHIELKQKLTPQQIIQAKILQLNSLNLEQRILEELELNPALEMVDLDENIDNDNIDDSEEELDENTQEENDFEWEELLGDPDEYEIRQPVSKDIEDTNIPIKEVKSLTENFIEQLRDLNASAEELKIAEQILGNLDDQGYLTIEPVLISDRMGLDEGKILSVMHRIQRLDPPGMASTNMRECLLAQLDSSQENSLEYKIMDKYFDDLANHRYEKIMTELDCNKDSLQNALEVISLLNPKPGDSLTNIEKDFVIPDVIAEPNEKGWSISFSDSSIPELVISTQYKKMLSTYKDKSDVKKFVQQKVESAQWFIEAIKQRRNTILMVMETIIQKQDAYFNSDKRELTPMILQDVADEIQMDISTVSRVTNGKFVQLPWEIKELKEFFSEGVVTSTGDEISNTVVKDKLKQLITSEDKQHPLSDEDLAKSLNKLGFSIARRTVTKYREQFKFPVARLRREL